KTTVPDVHRLLCGPHQDSAREAYSPEARSGAWRCVHAYAAGQAARLCSAEIQACMPDSSPATLAAALPLLDQAIVWLGWCDHPDCSRSSDKKTTRYCWRTQKCRNLCIPHTLFEGKKAWETYARKGAFRTLK